MVPPMLLQIKIRPKILPWVHGYNIVDVRSKVLNGFIDGNIHGAVFVFRNIDETFFGFSEVDERRQYQKWTCIQRSILM